MFALPKLPYAYDALEPVLSAQTLHIHHDKHHAGYVDTLNKLLPERPVRPDSLEQVIANAATSGDAKLFNAAAQCWNHAFLWLSMSSERKTPPGPLAAAIDKSFGGLNELEAAFVAEGAGHFGSGWVWLSVDRDGALKVSSTHDAHDTLQDSGVTPLLVCDVWEHAYYLDHLNDRKGFLGAWFAALPDWAFAATQFNAARAGQPGWRHPKAILVPA